MSTVYRVALKKTDFPIWSSYTKRGSTQQDQHGDRPPIENIGGGRLDWRQRRKIFFVRLRFRCLRYNWVELVVGQLWKKTILHRHLSRFERHKKNTFHFLH